MQKYIVIDTEGTGIFKHDETLPDGTKRVMRSDEVGQPRMAEFAAAVVDQDFIILDTFQQYIIPDGWQDWDGSLLAEMPPGAFEANKLTFDFLRANGRPVREALEYYSDRLAEGLIPLGYNMQFDGRQMRGELRRAGMDDRFNETPNVCAMRSMRAAGIKIKKLNGKGGMPRLIDCAAHFGVPGYTEDKHHKAAEDVFATVQIARHLNEMGKLIPPSVYRAKGLEGAAT
jgi:DNA polymerase-3 subunit epsilon